MTFVADAPIISQAFDPIAFIVVAIIVFNVIATLIGGVRRAAQRIQNASVPKSVAVTLSADVRSGAYAAAVRAARAAEMEKLRQTLLASGAVPRAVAAAQPYVVAAEQKIEAIAPSAPAIASRIFDQNATLLAQMATAQSQMPGMFLMSLESGADAFNQLAAPSVAAEAAAENATSPAAQQRRYGLFNGAAGAADAIVGAAIIGPCAALRPVGHTPGGW